MRSDGPRWLALALLAPALAGCGQKGPLYLPDKTGNVVTRPGEATGQTSPETAPAPASPAGSTTEDPGSKDDEKPKPR